MELRKNAISARKVARKMPISMRPDNNTLYNFFDGGSRRLSTAQIEKMKIIIDADAAEFKNFLDRRLPKC